MPIHDREDGLRSLPPAASARAVGHTSYDLRLRLAARALTSDTIRARIRRRQFGQERPRLLLVARHAGPGEFGQFGAEVQYARENEGTAQEFALAEFRTHGLAGPGIDGCRAE
jgi:hypothetical protein